MRRKSPVFHRAENGRIKINMCGEKVAKNGRWINLYGC